MIFFVGIFQMFEGATWVDIVAWIDAYLLTILRCHIGRMGREMNVGDKRLVVAVGFQARGDILHVLGFTCPLCRKTYQFAACVNDALSLCYAGLRIIGIGGSHRLYPDWVITADGDVPNVTYTTNSSYTHT